MSNFHVLESNADQQQHSNLSDLDDNHEIEFSDLPFNALRELNREDIYREYDLRKKLYEKDECFFSSFEIEETDDEELIKLKDNILKGRELLKNEISRYSTLKDKLEEINNLKRVFHEQILNIKRSSLILQEISIPCEGYQDQVHTMSQAYISLETTIDNFFDDKKKIIETDYNTSFKKLIQLKDMYKVLRHSDISYVCPLCLTNQVDTFVMSCGHTYCHVCVKKIQRCCSICREPISKINSLYFS